MKSEDDEESRWRAIGDRLHAISRETTLEHVMHLLAACAHLTCTLDQEDMSLDLAIHTVHGQARRQYEAAQKMPCGRIPR